MDTLTHKVALAVVALTCLTGRLGALDGVLSSHDPSSVALCNGKYYIFSTGNGIPISVSDDGFAWRRAGTVLSTLPGQRIPETVRSKSPNNNGVNVWAPDILHVNGTYFLYYSVSSWGDYASAVGLLTSPTLDQDSPDYQWTDRGPIVWSNGTEDLNAIDPGVFYDKTHDTMWVVYGSYHGTCRMVELDPKTGLRKEPDKPATVVASRSEAAALMAHDGWYYLFTNHGSCCNGATSTYHILVGRSKSVTGPFLDPWGVDMARGGGTLFLASGDGHIGPGHFGLLEVDGVQKFSCHYEADARHPGSIFDIRPLLWKDGWPVAGSDPKEGQYQILSKRLFTVVELAVPGVPAVAARGRQGGAGRGRGAATPPAAEPATNVGPPEPVNVRLASYLLQDQQKWTVAPAGGGYYRVVHASGRALQLSDGGGLNAAPFTGGDHQLWKMDQLSDGSFRIKLKANNRVLSAGRGSALTLAEFNPGDDNQKWILGHP